MTLLGECKVTERVGCVEPASEAVGSHWCYAVWQERSDGPPPRRVCRTVCECGWASAWWANGAVAVKTGLAHTTAATRSSS